MRKLILLGLGLYLLFGMGLAAKAEKAQPRVKAPTFSLPAVNGDQDECSVGGVSDKYTVLMFWTTWCPHCAVALQDMELFSQKYKNKIKFCAIALGEKPERLLSTIKKRHLTFPIANDTQGVIAYMYAVMGVPTIVVVDKQGYVVDYGFNLRAIINRLVRKI